MTIDYLSGQIEAGVEAVQLFDSWAGSLAPDQFERWVIAPTAAIVDGLKARHPNIPIIGFPKGAGGKLAAYAPETGVDVLGIDAPVHPAWPAPILPAHMQLPGNVGTPALCPLGRPLLAGVAPPR